MSKTKGQAFISILILGTIALAVGAAAVSLIFTQSQLSYDTRESSLTYHLTDGIIEDLFLKTLRNPTWEGEGTLNVEEATCKINAAGQNPKIITVSCQKNNKIKKIQAQVDFIDGRMAVSDIQEVP